MIVQQNPLIVSRKVGSSWVLLEQNKKFVRELNHVAGDIWKAAKLPISVDALVKSIAKRYHVPAGKITHDIEQFVAQYIRDGLFRQVS